jgi:hypothetical protein
MSKLRRYVPWTVVGTGALTFVAGDLLGLEGRALLAAALAGAVLLFVGVLAVEFRAAARCEGSRADQRRAGHAGFVLLGALLSATLLVLLTTGLQVAAETVLAAAVFVGIAAFQGSLLYQRRRSA